MNVGKIYTPKVNGISCYSYPGINTLSNADPEYLILLIANYFDITVKQLKSKSRLEQFVKPRQIAQYIIYRYSSLCLSEIGLLFNCDHATIIHTIKLIKVLKNDKKYGPIIKDIENTCNKYFIRYDRNK